MPEGGLKKSEGTERTSAAHYDELILPDLYTSRCAVAHTRAVLVLLVCPSQFISKTHELSLSTRGASVRGAGRREEAESGSRRRDVVRVRVCRT